MSFEFDQTALENWVALCSQEQQMRERGASQEDLDLMRARVIVEMTRLLPTLSEEEQAALALVLLSSPTPEKVTTESCDPTVIDD
jgi:hypothetical protein